LPGTGEKEKYQSPSATELPRKIERSRIPEVLSRKILYSRVYDDAGNVVEIHEHAGDFKEW
jgi:hypothetical protein